MVTLSLPSTFEFCGGRHPALCRPSPCMSMVCFFCVLLSVHADPFPSRPPPLPPPSPGRLTKKKTKTETCLKAEDLFYNMDTRRRAFKSPGEQYKGILDVVTRYAVHFGDKGVSFTCKKVMSSALPSNFFRPLSSVCCLPSAFFRLPSAVCCRLSTVGCRAVSCLQQIVIRIIASDSPPACSGKARVLHPLLGSVIVSSIVGSSRLLHLVPRPQRRWCWCCCCRPCLPSWRSTQLLAPAPLNP